MTGTKLFSEVDRSLQIYHENWNVRIGTTILVAALMELRGFILKSARSAQPWNDQDCSAVSNFPTVALPLSQMLVAPILSLIALEQGGNTQGSYGNRHLNCGFGENRPH